MLLAHLPSGYLLAYANEKTTLPIHKLSKAFKKRLVIVSIIGAAFPDIDTLPFLADTNGLSMHRHFITHTPLPYLILALAIYYLGTTLTKQNRLKLYSLSYAFISGCFLHLITDSIFGHIRWLYPLTNYRFSLYPITLSPATSTNLVDWSLGFITTPYFFPEIVIFILAAWLYWGVRYARD